MTVDLATLGIKVDASEADTAGVKLEQLAQAGGKAEASTKRVTSASDTYKATLRQMIAAITENTSALNSWGGAAGNAEQKTRGASSATEEMTQRLSRLKSSVDPLGVAIDRTNDELAEARLLFEAGAISAGEYARAQQVLSGRATDLAERQAIMNQRIANGGKAAKLTSAEALNLSRQFADIGVTAAMGMNPLMILIQQGPQIADIMKTSGLGIRGVFRELLLMVGILQRVPAVNAEVAASSAAASAANTAQAATATAAAAATEALAVAERQAAVSGAGAAAASAAVVAGNGAIAESATAAAAAEAVALAPLALIIAGIAAALGVVAAGFAIFANEAEKGLGDVRKEFGFTEDQMKKLKDSNTDTTVTMGDAWHGFTETVSDIITEAFGPQIKAVNDWFTELYNNIVEYTVAALKYIVGDFVGSYRAIQATWAMLPAAMGDVAISAVNYVIDAVEKMVNASANGINSLLDGLPDWIKPQGRVGTVSLGRLDNPYAGAASKAVDAGRDAYNRGMAEGGEMVDNFGKRWKTNTLEAREKRLRDAAGEPGKGNKGRKEGLSDEEKAYKKAVEAGNEYLDNLKEETAAIGLNTIELKRQQSERAAQAVLAAGATEETRKIAAAIREEQKAWEAATSREALRKLTEELSDQNDQVEFENSLIGKNAEARAVANAQREIELKLRALERDGIKLSADQIQAETDKILANARAKGRATDATEAANRQATAMRDMADSIKETTASFGELFGTAGEGFAGLLDTILDFDARQAESRAKLIELQEQYNNGQMSEAEYAFERGRVNDEMARSQISHYGDMISAAKGFFNEGSAGWRILEGAERAYRLFQFAMQIRSMLMDKAETASSVANSGARAAADGVAAVAKAIASLPFPLNIAAGAATIAALVAVGVKLTGGGKGASASAVSAASKSAAAYTGPTDEYGAPLSSYSVLRPGSTTAPGYSPSPNGPGAGMAGNVGNNVTIGDVNLTVQGNADRGTIEQIQGLLEQNRQQTLSDARQLAAQDRATAAGRQRIGGS